MSNQSPKEREQIWRRRFIRAVAALPVLIGATAALIAIIESRSARHLTVEPPIFIHLPNDQPPPELLWCQDTSGQVGISGLIHRIPVRLVNPNDFPMIITAIEIDWGPFDLDPNLPAAHDILELMGQVGTIPLRGGRLKGVCKYFKIYGKQSEMTAAIIAERATGSHFLKGFELTEDRGFPLTMNGSQEICTVLTFHLEPWTNSLQSLAPLEDTERNRAQMAKLIPLFFGQTSPGTTNLEIHRFDGALIPGAPCREANIAFVTNRGKLSRNTKISLLFQGTTVKVRPYVYHEGNRIHRKDLSILLFLANLIDQHSISLREDSCESHIESSFIEEKIYSILRDLYLFYVDHSHEALKEGKEQYTQLFCLIGQICLDFSCQATDTLGFTEMARNFFVKSLEFYPLSPAANNGLGCFYYYKLQAKSVLDNEYVFLAHKALNYLEKGRKMDQLTNFARARYLNNICTIYLDIIHKLFKGKFSIEPKSLAESDQEFYEETLKTPDYVSLFQKCHCDLIKATGLSPDVGEVHITCGQFYSLYAEYLLYAQLTDEELETFSNEIFGNIKETITPRKALDKSLKKISTGLDNGFRLFTIFNKENLEKYYFGPFLTNPKEFTKLERCIREHRILP